MRVINKIRLKPGITGEAFEAWVTEKDYVACGALSSVTAFSVFKVGEPQDGGAHYFEVIDITDAEAFEGDRETPVFKGLEAGFYALADVVETLEGGIVPPGYRAPDP